MRTFDRFFDSPLLGNDDQKLVAVLTTGGGVDLGVVRVDEYESLWTFMVPMCAEVFSKPASELGPLAPPAPEVAERGAVPASAAVIMKDDSGGPLRLGATAPSDWRPVPTVLADEWHAKTRLQLRYVVCIRERLIPRDQYVSRSLVIAYQLDWETRVLRASDGGVVAAKTLSVQPYKSIGVPQEGSPQPRAGVPAEPLEELRRFLLDALVGQAS